MATGEEELLRYVSEYMDKAFGSNLDTLDDLEHTIEQRQDLNESLSSEICCCARSAEDSAKKAINIGKGQIREAGLLTVEKSEVEWEVNQYLSKNTKFFAAFKHLHQDVEEVSCVQVYLSWLTQVIHLSFELKNEVVQGHLGIAVEYFANISDIGRQISKSKCDNLVDYTTALKDYWFTVLSDILKRELDGILERIKWPFPTGISSPMICDSNDEEILSKFASVVRQVLRISSQNESDPRSPGIENCLRLMEALVRPFQKRFSFHFYGARRTNNLEKPEWFFTQILNWIRDHSPFIINYIQPIVDEEGLQTHFLQHEFIKLLVKTAIEKVKSSLPQMITNNTLFSHMVDEVILFDNELCSMFDYPSGSYGCTSVLMTQPYISHWINLEEKRGLKAIDDLFSGNEPFISKYNSLGSMFNAKVPPSVENAITLISVITEKYRRFNDPEAQLKFVDLQLRLLESLKSKLQELSSLESMSFDQKVDFAVLNGCQFINDILLEWTEDVFFIKLQYVKSQMKFNEFKSSSHPSNARLDDSISGDHKDVSFDTVTEQLDSYLEHGLFDEISSSVTLLTASVMEKVVKSLENEFLKKLASYKRERWHCMPAPRDVIKHILPSSACSLFMAVKETLRNMRDELSPVVFGNLWQKYAKAADCHIFNELILDNHFNEGGASQIMFDMTKNFFVLFEEYTSKPESFFKLTKESCILLNLLPGSAALLQEVLVMSTKKSKKDQTASEATKALLDIGVNGISPEIALRILNSRVDWPRIQ